MFFGPSKQRLCVCIDINRTLQKITVNLKQDDFEAIGNCVNLEELFLLTAIYLTH